MRKDRFMILSCKSALSLIFLLVFSLAVIAQENPEEYRKTLEMADSYFAKGDYINAKASYQIAVKLNPNDQYAKDRLQQSLNMIKVQMQQNALYAEKIMVADELYKAKDMQGALVAYNAALAFLPGDTYATGRIQEIEKSFADAKKKEEDYAAGIAAGDKLLAAGNLPGALAEYKKASDLKPEENYPKQKIAEIDQSLADQKLVAGSYEKALADAETAISRQKYDEAILQLENASRMKPAENFPKQRLAEVRKLKTDYESYSSIIETADNYYIEKDFEKAKAEYEKALTIKPGDEYPKSMLDKIDIALMDISKANRSSYELAIAEADKLYSQQDYEQAMVAYNNALRFKPDEDYAKQRIGDINNMLSLKKSQDEAYSQSISRADEMFKEQRYDEALEAYNQAITFRPMEQYPKVKIDEIKTIKANLQNQRQIYSSLIAGADKLYYSDDYVEAREQYRKASDMFPKEQYPLDQIKMINEILGLRDTYNKAITDADKLLYEKKYDAALDEYKKAAALDENEIYAEGKIYEIETMIAEQQIAQAQQRQYDSVLYIADDQFAAGDYIKAMESYQAAQAILPGEGYPKKKLEEINRIEADKAAAEAIDKQYLDALSRADQLLAAKDYTAAIQAYEGASKLKPAEAYPAQKIAEANTALKDIAAKEALDKQYSEAIAAADKLMAAKDYEDALAAYQNALALKPGEQYPTSKVSEITAIMGDIAAKEAFEKQYTDAVSKADALVAAKDYQGALAAYESAAKLKPGDAYPADRIKEINVILGDIAAKEALDKQYTDAVSSADKLMAAGDYTRALQTYQQAASLKPDENYPGMMIAEVTNIMGKIAAEEALDKQYAETVANADKLLAAQDYQGAMAAYEAAAKLKPSEAYPGVKIGQINKTLDEIAANQAALDKQYDNALAKGNELLEAKDYTGAIASFEAASKLKPAEEYPKLKVDEARDLQAEAIAKQEALDKQYAELIVSADKLLAVKDYSNALVAYQDAALLKPVEKYPADKIAEINGTLADIAAKEALDKQYAVTLSNGDKLLAEKDYQGALTAYQTAKSLKPAEKYPVDKITEVNGILADIAAKEALDKQYAQLISEADGLAGQMDFAAAKKKYEAALTLKPGETVATAKIAEMDAALAEVAKKADEDKRYNDAIAFGDKHFASKDYDNARLEYNKALAVKPGEAYPTGKLSEIEGIEEEIRKQKELDAQYNKTLASAEEYMKQEKYEEARFAYQEALKLKPGQEYPEKQLAEIGTKLEFQAQEREQAYSIAISKADNYFQQQDWAMAKVQYERATELKSDQVYPLDQLKIVNEEIMKQRQVIQAEYDKAIADADKYYASKLYDNAIESYRASSIMKPDEEYPKEMVRRILKMLSERSIVQINKNPLLIPNNTQHKFDFLSVPVKDRKSNYLYFTARNVSEKEYKLIVNFGQDAAKNGGFVVKVPPGGEQKEFIVRISAQYKWFSDDNNWITFYPEGGDIEVSLLQISYSD